MRISLFIEHGNLDSFYKWVNRLSEGHIESPTVQFSHKKDAFIDPLEIQLSGNEYAMITDARDEIERLSKIGGPIDITYIPKDKDWQMSTIRNIIKNSDRHDLTPEVIYTALTIIGELNTLTPAEAMIIAEGEWIK